MAKAGSMLNTPPTFAWYAAGLVFQWLLEQGGLSVIAQRNEKQAGKVYQLIDRYDCYTNNIHPLNRSLMNIPFQLVGRDDKQFLAGANEHRLLGLKGHKSIGGLRASLYNAVTDAAVDQLADYLTEFAER
jgi:phosphoserine aminotransferase